MGLSMGGSTLFAQSAARLNLAACKQARRSPSLVPRAVGASKSQEVRRRRIRQLEPAKLEIYRADEDMRPASAGYKTLQKTAAGMDARAEIAYGQGVVFHVNDRWNLTGPVLSVRRTVTVTGSAPGGFCSSVMLTVDPAVSWSDVSYMAPATLYGDPTYDGDRSPGGKLNHDARRLNMREDVLPAPLFALSFNNGASIAVLDPAPRPGEALAEADSADRSSWARTTNPPSPIHRPASTRSATTFLTASSRP